MQASRLRTVLLIAYHYPPCAMSSGVQRTLSFSMHLRKHGWRPVVLTANAGSYERANAEQLRDIPQDLSVARTLALDAARQLAVGGRYWSRLAVPDRWRAWWLTAVPCGLHLIRRHSIDAIWSTYPIATAHAIGHTLARITGLPWVADFRDPMVEILTATGEAFPRDPVLRSARLHIESRVARRASRIVFCTEGARRIVAARYPGVPSQRLEVISNGYEERAFADVAPAPSSAATSARRVLLHSGTVYPGEDRDPSALMRALRMLADRQIIAPANFELRLRDPSHEEHFRRLSEQLGVADLVSICPPISYREALAEMLSADGLLLLQGYPSNPAVPAKLYEYLRASRPIVALVHPDGETAATLRSLNIDTMSPLTDPEPIAKLLERWLADPMRLQAALPARDAVAGYSRERLTARLARVLDEATSAAG